MKNSIKLPLLLATATALVLSACAPAQTRSPAASTSGMSFFVTSSNAGKGADFGGLSGADQYCQKLAASAGAGGRSWRAYLSNSALGGAISGRGDPVNSHDILTGSQADGRAFAGDKDMTCGNWTKSGVGSAMVGHHDRKGLRDDAESISWNSSHPTKGCGMDALKSTGGAGLLYCFAAN